jgi:hypothetical protein
MKKGVVIGIIIIIVIIGTISAYSMINQNSNNINEIIPSTPPPVTTGVNHSIELTEGITMTAPSP